MKIVEAEQNQQFAYFSENKKMTKQIYQIKIVLKGSKPRIWRRLLIPSNLPLADLHKVIQTAMGWTNSHLHQFIDGNVYYSVQYLNEDDWFSDCVDYKKKKLRVSDLLIDEKDKIVYEYDFGDGWEHTITLEKILPMEKQYNHPICIAAKMHCPPEDCGGVYGYMHLLEIIANPNHEEYDDTLEWLGDYFDPKHFSIETTNELLSRKDYGCLEEI